MEKLQIFESQQLNILDAAMMGRIDQIQDKYLSKVEVEDRLHGNKWDTIVQRIRAEVDAELLGWGKGGLDVERQRTEEHTAHVKGVLSEFPTTLIFTKAYYRLLIDTWKRVEPAIEKVRANVRVVSWLITRRTVVDRC